MHNPGNCGVPSCAAIEFDPLDERRGAISDADNGDPDVRHLLLLLVPHATERRIGIRRRTTQNAISSTGCATIPMRGRDPHAANDGGRSWHSLRRWRPPSAAVPARPDAIGG